MGSLLGQPCRPVRASSGVVCGSVCSPAGGAPGHFQPRTFGTSSPWWAPPFFVVDPLLADGQLVVARHLPAVEEGTVGAVEVPQEDLARADQERAGALADEGG
jgi:hypothetical protein